MATPTGIDVAGMTSGLEGTVTDYLTPTVNPVLVAGTNPNRVYLLVLFSTSTGLVMPSPGSKVLGYGPDVSGQPGGRLLHVASLPGLVWGEWWAWDAGVGTIRVYDVERLPKH